MFGAIPRHIHVFAFASSAGLTPRREVPHLVPGSQSRPADVFLPVWEGGLPTAVDISVVSTLQEGLVVAGAAKAGHALASRVASKISLHTEYLLSLKL